MIAAVVRQIGQMAKMGSGPWGWFVWSEMKGEQDKGILVISAYRVSQTKATTASPYTAYSQQINNMIQEGNTNLDPMT